MKTLKFLLQKEFRQIFRNPWILRLIIAMPIVQLIILPLAADYEIKHIRISIVDHDHSIYSQKLAERILSSGYFNLNDYGSSYANALEQFQTDKSDIILEIPSHFEKDLVKQDKASLFIAVNAINGAKAAVGSNYLARIITGFNSEIRMEWQEPMRAPVASNIEIVTASWFNLLLNYPPFMVPGILVLLVTMIGSYMCALNIVKEKEIGTIEQINVTPIRKHHFILGKMIPFWIIGLFVFSIGLFGVARLVYGIVPAGSIAALYSFLGVYLVAVLGIGLLISTYCNTQQQAMSLAFFFMMIFVLMGGLFTPVDSMPGWAQWIAAANPVTYFIDVTRKVVLKGSGFRDILPHFGIMALIAVFFNTWAILNYKKTS